MPALTLHVEADTLQELLTKTVTSLSALNITLNIEDNTPKTAPVASTTPPAETATRRGPGRPPKASPTEPAETPAEETKAETPAEEPAEEPTGDGAGEALTYDANVKPAILGLAERKGRDTVIELLKAFGVGNASDIPPEKYPDLLKRVRDLTEA